MKLYLQKLLKDLTKVNPRVCREATLGKCTLIGNINPFGVMCRGIPPGLVIEKAREAIAIFPDPFYIFQSI